MDVISRYDAETYGLKKFFTGEPCSHGHKAERWVSSGCCVECALDQRRTNRLVERTPKLHVQSVSKHSRIPKRKTTSAACYDIYADTKGRRLVIYSSENKEEAFNVTDRIPVDGRFFLQSGCRVIIPTGYKMACDPEFRIDIYARSGSALKDGITLANCTGIIDADYREEVGVVLVNTSNKPFEIRHGDRIAQLALNYVIPLEIVVGELPRAHSNRNGGFGSTG